jgi:hypothetical protein
VGKPHLHNVVMFMLSSSILLVGVGARNLMRDTNGTKEGIKFLILPTPIRLNGNNLVIKLSLNKMLEFQKVFKHLGLRMKQINLSKFIIIIDEANIVFLTTKRINSSTPHIRKNKL